MEEYAPKNFTIGAKYINIMWTKYQKKLPENPNDYSIESVPITVKAYKCEMECAKEDHGSYYSLAIE